MSPRRQRRKQKKPEERFDKLDILTNCRQYPIGEAPAAYKDFNGASSGALAGLASEVARLSARLVIKDSTGGRLKTRATVCLSARS